MLNQKNRKQEIRENVKKKNKDHKVHNQKRTQNNNI